ncbi:MAG: hypothetical protein EPN23_08235 [Verrucomicrobia bacterium]|nr:MAG: hypothetical protein EPN23_08235 [Verrucomicrobiota bacterium]
MLRREFLQRTACGAAAWAAAFPSLGKSVAAGFQALEKSKTKPNILLIITDQQNATMMSCTGNRWVKTPNMDRLAAEGVRFERAYCANPVCIPSRFSMFTGTMPSAIGMDANEDEKNSVAPEILAHAMGTVFQAAGYRTVYAGKVHLPGQPGVLGNVQAYGFAERLAPKDPEGRAPTVQVCADFLKAKHDKPFLLVASLINPHDICYLPLREWVQALPPSAQRSRMLAPPALAEVDAALKIPAGVSAQEFYDKYCPPLPANHAIPEQELTAFMATKRGSYLGWARQNYSEHQWRRYRWVYARLTERVDAEIGQLLDALRAAGLDNNTVVVFTSDHGDQAGAHRVVTKDYLYEESTRVPFMVRWTGVTQAGRVDTEHFVASGLDLIPTLCDFAGVPAPAALKGCSVRPLAEGRAADDWRKYVVVENRLSRLVHSGRWKYMVGHADTITPKSLEEMAVQQPVREMLIDLEKDPGEMTNLADDPASRPQLEEGRRLLQAWYAAHKLKLDSAYIVKD